MQIEKLHDMDEFCKGLAASVIAMVMVDDARSPADAVQILSAAVGKLSPTVAQNATVTPDPDSPADPTVCRPGCDRKFGHLGECEPPEKRTSINTMEEAWDNEEDSLTGCDPTDCDICQTQEDRAKPRDIVGEAERRRERQKLVLKFALRIANHAGVDCAADMADAYLAWRDADEAAARERICKK